MISIANQGTKLLRRGMTLIEILIAIFVLAIGLLGVAALLPLGQQQMKRGSIDQRATEVAAKAFESVQTYGLNRPDRWVDIDFGDPTDSADDVVRLFDAVSTDGTRVACRVISGNNMSFVTDAPAPPIQHVDNYYNDCIIEFVRGDLLRGIKRRADFGNGSNFTMVSSFPSVPSTDDVFVIKRNQPFAIDPLYVAISLAKGATVIPDFAPGVPRLSMTWAEGASTIAPMVFPAAESIFVSSDDLVFEKTSDHDVPTRQIFYSEPYVDEDGDGAYDAGVDTFDAATHDLNGNGVWDGMLKRQFRGEFSWLATFVPTEGRSDSQHYEVSIAVFHKRPIQIPIRSLPYSDTIEAGDQTSPQVTLDLEFPTTGLNYGGGGVTISTNNPNLYGAVFDDVNGNNRFQPDIDRRSIKPGQWIMVTSSVPNDDLNIATRWYRLASVGDPYFDTTGNPRRWKVNARMVGADWDTVRLGSTAQATVYESLVGVFQRTMKIQTLPVGSVPKQ